MEGYFLYHGDKTTCGGRILSGASDETYNGKERVRERDPVSCGKHEGRFKVCGGMGDTYEVNGEMREWAGSIESYSPARAVRVLFLQCSPIPTILTATVGSRLKENVKPGIRHQQ
ncbi:MULTISPECIES: PAAR domain-containing protein [Enterobacterales]|uniref:PAAR domain-containing protein n=1 Tax=Enterobacterales TaxID=91347 RepID=UPI002ED7D7AE